MLALFLAPAIGHYIPTVPRPAGDADGHQICLVWTDSGYGHNISELVSACRLARDGRDASYGKPEREWHGGWIAGVSERT